MPADLYPRQDSIHAPATRRGLRIRPAAVISWVMEWRARRRRKRVRAVIEKLRGGGGVSMRDLIGDSHDADRFGPGGPDPIDHEEERERWIQEQGAPGHAYPCKPSVFEQTYRPAEDVVVDQIIAWGHVREIIACYDSRVPRPTVPWGPSLLTAAVDELRKLLERHEAEG